MLVARPVFEKKMNKRKEETEEEEDREACEHEFLPKHPPKRSRARRLKLPQQPGEEGVEGA